MSKITGVYVNAKTGKAEPRTIEANLDEYYKLLDVSTIDIVTRKIGETYYDIICDDEALLKNRPIISMIDSKCNPMLFGNLFIVKHDGRGELKSLTKADVNNVLGATVTLLSTKGFRTVMVGDY